MTRYAIVNRENQRHPDQPADGFQFWTAAEMWIIEHLLAPQTWRVIPIAEDTP